MGIEPIGEDALISAAELAGTGEHAAAVYKDGEAKRFTVFEGERFAGELGGTIERDGGGGREQFRDAVRAHTRRKRRGRGR